MEQVCVVLKIYIKDPCGYENVLYLDYLYPDCDVALNLRSATIEGNWLRGHRISVFLTVPYEFIIISK